METKVREFWIDLATKHGDPCDFVSEGMPHEHPSSTNVHVIEYSAYEKLEAENKKLREALGHIKEYWNGTYTVSALGDFANYTIDTCSEALGEVGE